MNGLTPTLDASAASRRTRVLEVTGAMFFGGAERVIAHLCSELDKSRFEPIVCCTRGIGPLGEQLRTQGIEVLLVRASPPARWARRLDPAYLYDLIKRYRPDVVHTHGLPALSAVGPLSYFGVLPYWVHTFHYGNYPYARRRHMLLERVLCKRSDALIAVANSQREAVIRQHNVQAERVGLIYNGVRSNPFIDKPGVRAAKRAELGLTTDDLVVGSVAVLSEQKGVTYLLRAACDVLARYPATKFVIVGGGPLEDKLKEEAGSLGLDRSIKFTGWRSDVAEILTALDIYVMPSLWEAMPLALLEAMAASRPIVVTDVGDNARFVGQGEFGLVVPPRDVPALARAICDLISEPNRLVELGARASGHYEQNFTVEHMVRAYEKVYAEAAPAAFTA